MPRYTLPFKKYLFLLLFFLLFLVIVTLCVRYYDDYFLL